MTFKSQKSKIKDKNQKSASEVICPNMSFNAYFWNFEKILRNVGEDTIFVKKFSKKKISGSRAFSETEKSGSNFEK